MSLDSILYVLLVTIGSFALGSCVIEVVSYFRKKSHKKRITEMSR